MSSAYSANQQQTSVAHVMFDSLTRCFHPTDGETSLFSCPSRSSRKKVVNFPGSSNNPKTQPPLQQQPPQPPQPPPPQPPPQPPQPPHQYDSDRYIHRKLEIFRTTEEECLAEFGVAPRNKGQSSSHTRNNRRGHNRSGSGGANTLAASSDDEIKNLTENQKRKSAQGSGTRSNNAQVRDESLVATLVRLLRDPLGCITNVQGQYNDSLCFATPVRASSRENVANLSDWKLTAEEFAARYGVDRGGRCGKFDAPGVDESSASLSHSEEEETITSASYFDQKYSHLIETNPPMPLFDDHRVAVSERETGAIFKIAKNRREAHEANSNRGKTDPQQGGSGGRSRNTTPRSSPVDHIRVITKTPRRMALSKKSKKGSSPTKGVNTKKGCDLAPAGKSSSVSDTSHEGEQHHHRHNQQHQKNFREAYVVHYTLGE